MESVADLIKRLIRDVPDFPKPGIMFKDLTPVFLDPDANKAMVGAFADRYKPRDVDAVVAIESRGFLLGAPLASALHVPLVLVRKPGKLPRATFKRSYDLEYGQDSLEIHQDALTEGQKVVVVDDLLATGGTASAAVELVHEFGAQAVEAAFMVELTSLSGRDRVPIDTYAMIQY